MATLKGTIKRLVSNEVFQTAQCPRPVLRIILQGQSAGIRAWRPRRRLLLTTEAAVSQIAVVNAEKSLPGFGERMY